VLATTVAGPLTTLYVIAPVDAERADTINGGFPYVCAGAAEKVSVAVPAFTVSV
jgi:hypothetical protein